MYLLTINECYSNPHLVEPMLLAINPHFFINSFVTSLFFRRKKIQQQNKPSIWINFDNTLHLIHKCSFNLLTAYYLDAFFSYRLFQKNVVEMKLNCVKWPWSINQWAISIFLHFRICFQHMWSTHAFMTRIYWKFAVSPSDKIEKICIRKV